MRADIPEYIHESTNKFRYKILSHSAVIHLQMSMTKYPCFQYSVIYRR